MLNKTQSNLQKLNDTYSKLESKLHKEEEKVHKFETNINLEIADRIGEILKQKIQMDKEIMEIKIKIIKKDNYINELEEERRNHLKEMTIE